MQIWSLYQEAKTWKTRPSTLLGMEDAYLAYCLDQAVSTFGNFVQNKIDSVEGKNKAEIERKTAQILGDILNLPDEKRFRSARPPTPGA